MTQTQIDMRLALEALLALYPAHGGVPRDQLVAELTRRSLPAQIIETLSARGYITIADSGTAVDGGTLAYIYVTDAGAQLYDEHYEHDKS